MQVKWPHAKKCIARKNRPWRCSLIRLTDFEHDRQIFPERRFDANDSSVCFCAAGGFKLNQYARKFGPADFANAAAERRTSTAYSCYRRVGPSVQANFAWKSRG